MLKMQNQRILWLLSAACLLANSHAADFSSPALVSQTAIPEAEAGGSPTYLIKQGFEGTGYDNSESWTTGAGSPNPDSTDNAYEGTHSLFTGTGNNHVLSPSFAGQGEIWAFGTAYVTTHATSGGRWILKIRDAGNNTLGGINARTTDGGIRVNHGSVNTIQTDITFAVDTRYFWWLRWVKATGAGNDGIAEFYVSSNETKPESPQLTTSVGTSTADATHILLGGDAASGNFAIYQDKIRVDDSVIGSTPE